MASLPWHRIASRPVTVWMLLFLLAGLTHTFIPGYRWVLIHLFTLGVVGNSIVLWSQTLTGRFLGQDTAWRPLVARLAVFNLGVVLTVAGQLTDLLPLTHAGVAVLALALLWHALALGRAWWRAGRHRHRPLVAGYVISALFFPIGGFLGALLADDTSEELLAAHLAATFLGFVGIAAAASLSILFPAIWRVQGTAPFTPMLVALTLGAVGAIAVPLIDAPLFLYAAGWLLGLVGWLRQVAEVLRDPRDRIGFASVSVLAAVLWLIGSLVALGFGHRPVLPLLVGFAAQLLLGVMSHQLPAAMRGGPGAVRAGAREMERAGLFRVTLVNGGLAVWLAADNSWLKVAASVLCLGALAAFLPLMRRASRAQIAVIRKQAEAPPRPSEPRPAWNQVTAGVAVLALLLGAFGGLASPSTTVVGTGAEQVTQVEVRAVGYRFEPDVIDVPSGHRVLLRLRNDDPELAHDLRLDSGVTSGRLVPGEEVEMDLGVITADLDGRCTIAGHHAQGMVLSIRVL
ncbi:MAG: copper oxidase [Corynebacterium sp.]|uniref:copper oxidase n=1 Tax=Corynebacterium sp. TaxID=1720 RepID=UPI0026E0503B|nr:copper oxidase [Corynebacterium sp.]MDO5669274.1 copper oxidase [Corynebacterium sp.]